MRRKSERVRFPGTEGDDPWDRAELDRKAIHRDKRIQRGLLFIVD